jgi:glycosyltransferase involved in cell wall biosynthesis
MRSRTGARGSLKILLVHNFYQRRGGEDVVFEAERRMLEHAGDGVVSYTRHNDEIDAYALPRRTDLALRTVWAWDSHRELLELLKRESPDVAHFTNTFPLISPSAYDACDAAGVAVVQSLHNYRLVCPAATLWRDGHPCEECIDHGLTRSVRHGCYRGSRAATSVLAGMLAIHRLRKTWSTRVDRYIALTGFARERLIAGGLPADRIVVKPNFVDPDPRAELPVATSAAASAAPTVLFAGRLEPEKGVYTLLDAWQQLADPIPLRIAGEGSLLDALRDRIAREAIPGVELLGVLSRDRLLEELSRARLLVFPSEWYEGMPMILLEAMACGVPAVASRLGGMPEMIDEGRIGRLFHPGNAGDLAAKVSALWSDPEQSLRLGAAARAEFETRYTRDANYAPLIAIYREAIEARALRLDSVSGTTRTGRRGSPRPAR